MKSKTLTFFLLIFPVVSFGQYNFRPILDSTAACSFNNRRVTYKESIPNPFYEYKEQGLIQVYYIVEEMPKPKIPKVIIENILKKDIRMNAQELILSGTVYLQCIVNCKGEAGDFQIVHCPSEFINTGCQIVNVFHEKIADWEPGKQKGKNVDVFAKIKVTVQNGNFKVNAPIH